MFRVRFKFKDVFVFQLPTKVTQTLHCTQVQHFIPIMFIYPGLAD